jgi:hypothetical protein
MEEKGPVGVRMDRTVKEDFTEYQELWDDMQKLRELHKSVHERRMNLILGDSHRFAQWRRFLKEKEKNARSE